MKALTFAQEFALIALNAQDSLHMTTVKKIAVRCMAAAAILEWAMAEDGLQSEFPPFRERCGKRSGVPAPAGGFPCAPEKERRRPDAAAGAAGPGHAFFQTHPEED